MNITLSGLKGKGDYYKLMRFSTVSAETLKDSWVNDEHLPQPGMIVRFLEEAKFPDEMSKNPHQLYRECQLEQKRQRAKEVQDTQKSAASLEDKPAPSAKSVINKRLLIGVLVIVVILILGITIWAILSAQQQANLASQVGTIAIVSAGNQLLTLQTLSQAISAPGQTVFPVPIKVGETVTLSFQVQNTDTHVVRIMTLSGGAQGPSFATPDWTGSTPQSPFQNAYGILLQPGEAYEYRQSRSFSAPGNYFVEPTMQDALGRWGGISPSPRIYFTVK